ncbi:hypothetical protein GGR88_001368 [Sphingomonas jejuensis]|uniref:Amidophosphoribosyltransferase n=1 Tax=Sphingomonas jejuensis TaxID=904715 RepID=A0ABX0XM53_9SPHN|nr:hypothetical protein [Sphingomonas jejuensis]NJC33894.1 hypothetical protein [Sphingomonas jejuensis]
MTVLLALFRALLGPRLPRQAAGDRCPICDVAASINGDTCARCDAVVW